MPRRFGAPQPAPLVALLDGAGLECAEQRLADTAKSRVRRNVVEGDLSRIGDAAHRKDAVVFDRDQQRVVRSDPRPEYFRRFVVEPSLEDIRIISVIGNA